MKYKEMFNYYIEESSYTNAGIQKFATNLIELTKVLTYAHKEESFYKNDSKIWTINIDNNSNFAQVLCTPKFNKINGIHGIFKRINHYAESYNDMSESNPSDINAAWGIVFNPKLNNNLTTFKEYDAFRQESTANIITPSNFKKYAKFVFKKIVFCDNAYKQISILDSNTFRIFLPEMQQLDKYNVSWSSGQCTTDSIKLSTGINISNESDSVNQDPKLKSCRYFKLPDNRTEYFEMHIKKGSQRMHIYPDNDSKIIYIGYIGNHLPTAKYK